MQGFKKRSTAAIWVATSRLLMSPRSQHDHNPLQYKFTTRLRFKNLVKSPPATRKTKMGDNI